MKTNTIHMILGAVFISVIALVAGSKVAVDCNLVAAGISYVAVAIIAAVAAVDYRRGSKNYTVN